MARGRKRGAAVLALVGCSALVTVPAAHGQVYAGPPNTYLTPEVTIDQGETATFVNADAVEHDVVARKKGADAKPLFRSELIGFSESAPIEGTQYLVSGSYAFFCSLHPQMEGTLTVSSAGKPKPAPDAKGTLKLRVLDSKVSKVRSRGALRVRATTNRPATIRMTARANGAVFAKGTVKAAASGSKTGQLRLTRAGRKLAARRNRIALTVSGSDGKGAKAKAKATLR